MKNSIRISGGYLKGKKIPFDFKDSLRPTSNKLKEIIFNWLQFEINDFVCLDLFAGTGSLGIEAISRNAQKVFFVELNKKNYSVLTKNIKLLDIKDKSKVIFKDAFEWIKKNNLSNIDLILLDPPFNQEYEIKLLKLLSRKNDIKPSCKIYLEHSKFTEVEVPEDFKILKNKIVGDVRALLLEKK
jgi:16S rRNA (guanine966-N2)-methyltransferase|tara:strand:- start:968 stop:1522 length:555 start_codon:yes stop_codon:yes gene_type:complete